MAGYEYDGLARRVKKHVDSESPANADGIDAYVHVFHNSVWQAIEKRESASENYSPVSIRLITAIH